MTQQRDVVESLRAEPSPEAELEEPEPVTAQGAAGRRPKAGLPVADLAMLAGLMAATAFLWGRAGGMSFWLDEGISMGVASHPLTKIPSVLLQDGSPPLYYLLLHVWTSVFGSSNFAAHALSLLFSVALVPVALWSGWSLFDRRTGWMLALLVAINPFAAFYATETRMYSLAALLGLVSATAFVHAFAFGRRRYLVLFAVAQALLMYTHNWGLLLGLGLAAAVVPCWLLAGDRRRIVVDAALGFGAVAVLYAPWVPSLLYQVRHDLQPWGRRGDLVWVRDDLAHLFGGSEAVVALVLAAGIGIIAVVEAGKRTAAIAALVALGLSAAVTVLVGWRTSVWAYRYLAVLVGPLLLLGALGLARAGRVAVAAVAAAAFVGGPFAVKGPPYQKSNAEAVASAASPRLGPGDLVVVPDFQMVPLLAHYLPDGLRYATTSGPVPDEDVVDWRDSLQRLEQSDPAVTLPPLVEALPAGAHLLLACPLPETDAESFGLSQSADDERSGAGGADNSDARPDAATPAADDAGGGDQAVTPKTTPEPGEVPFHALIVLRCQQTHDLLTSDPRLRLEDVFEAPDGVRNTAVDARVLVRVPAQRPR